MRMFVFVLRRLMTLALWSAMEPRNLKLKSVNFFVRGKKNKNLKFKS